MEDEFFEIDTDFIQNYVFDRLMQFNMVPGEHEMRVLADIVFDLLVDLGVIEEVSDEE
ncbi:YozD family protein [Bacillus bombysepticus]|uniref:YozD family protein n=1 Tax=Bacillus bombysepticus TaxID=658666 RepID=UPI003019CC9B